MTYSVVLRRNGQVIEGVPVALVHEAIRALPNDSNERVLMQSWANIQDDIIISYQEISQLLEGLSLYAHESQSEMGEVERLPHDSSGLIISGEEINPNDKNMINTTVVLALAFRRLLSLISIGAEIVIVTEETRQNVSQSS